MVTYFIKSGICLALLLAFYHLILEREKMHQFNRFYLLGSLLFSFVAPLYKIHTTVTAKMIPMALDNSSVVQVATPNEEIDYAQFLLVVYAIVAMVLMFRFTKNLVSIYLKIQKHQKIKKGKAFLVLVDDMISPHTFLNYIFINKEEYNANKIETELYTHELTHALQKHTFDILLIEFLQAIFWINPAFIFLKKAVKLNHEFLADSKVITTHNNTTKYQYLLLNRATWNNEYYLASNLNYLLTKKRLLMMTKQSSRTKVLLKQLAVIPVLAGFTILFAERVEAYENINDDLNSELSLLKNVTERAVNVNNLKHGINNNRKAIINNDSIPKNKRIVNHKNKTFTYTTKEGKTVSKKISELTKEEKKMLPPPPPKTKSLVIKKTKPSTQAIDDNKTGFVTANNQTLYYVKNKKGTVYYNRWGQIVTKEGKIINPEQTASDKVIPGQNISKIYKDGKVTNEFKETNITPPPPPKPNQLEGKKSKDAKSAHSTNKKNDDNVTYYLNNKLITKEKLDKIDPKTIKEVNVKKDKNGNGSIYITTKQP